MRNKAMMSTAMAARLWAIVLIAVASLPGCALPALAEVQTQGNTRTAVLQLVNRARLISGLAPLAVNPALEKAAQRHSDDMANKGFVDHIGSDRSTPLERISAVGYAGWPDKRVWAENVYAGNQGFAEALDFFLKDEVQRQNLLNPRYREVGVGIATANNAAGTPTVYWTLVFGAQPNVLPIFINDGATLINASQVAIHLSQEEAAPGGAGSLMGRAIEVRVSSDASFKGVEWQPWEALIPFTFDTSPGLKSVFVQLRDGGGRTSISTASVQFDPNSKPQVAPLGPGAQISPGLPGGVAPDASPTAFATLAPVRTLPPPTAPSTGTLGLAATRVLPATAMVLVVSPPTAAVINPTPVAAATLQTAQARPLLVDRPDATLPDWLLPAYAVGQILVIVLAVAGFLRQKRVPTSSGPAHHPTHEHQ
jgi:uncharacterized protein YkwD